MVKSMTGFGRAQLAQNGRAYVFEIKSVNSRYFEYASRLPRSFAFADAAIKKALGAVIKRGKVDVHLSALALEDDALEISANLPAARSYYAALCEIAADLKLENNLKAADFVRFPDVFLLRRGETDEAALLQDVLLCANAALGRFDEMRAAEGARLAEDLAERLACIWALVGEIEQGSEGRVQRYNQRLAERLRALLEGAAPDEGRLLTEAAIFADKTDVNEETVRLKSHIQQFRQMLKSEDAVGRKLDFLTQELNREANTVASKCQEAQLTRIAVDMKAEIEKIREQVQNVE